MKFFENNRQIKPRSLNIHMIAAGCFIGLSYVLSLLPLALFTFAQTLAIFGKKSAFLLGIIVVIVLCVLAIFTGYPPIVLGAIFSVIATPIFLIVSILRQKRTSILWSFGLLFLPVVLFFGVIVSAPVLTSEQYDTQLQKIENTLSIVQSQNQKNVQNSNIYEKAKEQIELVKHDPFLRKFMGYHANQKIIYFVYGGGFTLLFGFLLSFFASLFFLDLAFEQVEKFRAIYRYVRSLPTNSFDVFFLTLLKNILNTEQSERQNHLDEQVSESGFKIVKHIRITETMKIEKPKLFGFLRTPRPSNAISFRDYIFYYTGKLPGWSLRSYQIPLIFCVLSIIVLSGVIFYYGSVQNIIIVQQIQNPLTNLIVILSVLSICVLTFLVLQGIFTLLKWVPFGLLVFIGLVFLLITPYIMVGMGSFLFLCVFGIIGLLGYLK